MNPISNKQRFLTSSSKCPICGGYDRIQRGLGMRCCGFICDDPEYVVCTREEHAGDLEPLDTQPEGYKHKLHGECKCGIQHGASIHKFPGTTKPKKQATQDHGKVVAEYIYRDKQGRPLYQVLRHEDKHFSQRRSENGRWVSGINGIPRLPYCLPELLKASLETNIYIPEGEKDVDNLRIRGLIATCNSGGACNWDDNLNQYFKGRRVVLLADNDDKGREHVELVAKKLQGIASRITVIHLSGLPEKGDVSDWFTTGGTKEKLEQIVQSTDPTWEAKKRKFKYASDVQIEPVDWLWKKRLARGMLTLMVGDPGLGKSMGLMKIAATVTTGGGLPDNTPIEPGGVIIMAPEDSDEHTIVPRLMAAGADLTKVILLTKVTDCDKDGNEYERPISFPEDAPILEEAIIDCKASLAIIDPVLAMISEKYDSHKDQAVRLALGRVTDVAAKQHCAVMGVVHLNKAQSGNALYRSSASIGFIGMARVGLFVVPDPDNERGGVIVNHKNNLADRTKTASIRYSFHETEQEIGYIEWEGASEYSQQELLNQSTPTDNKKSVQEMGILEVLKEQDHAMTIDQIHAQLDTNQSLDAVERMLQRKVNQGILIRPAKGLYTYNGNPLYTAKPSTGNTHVGNVASVSRVGVVGSVAYSNIATGDKSDWMSPLENEAEEAYGEGLGIGDNSDIDSERQPILNTVKTCYMHTNQPVVRNGMCQKCYTLYSQLKAEVETLAQEINYIAVPCWRKSVGGTQEEWAEVINNTKSDMQLTDLIGAIKTYQSRQGRKKW